MGAIINGYPAGDPNADPLITQHLTQYADEITEWARATAWRMIREVSHADLKGWAERTKEMSRQLQYELRHTDVGLQQRLLLMDQVDLIQSLPLEAAQRVHRLTLEGIVDGTRANEVAKEIMRSGEVTASRAQLIARTEVSRTASTLLEARARAIGSEGYYWQTSGDGAVRKSHKAMNKKFVRWDDPPTLDKLTGHAGCLPNCRCWEDPQIP